MSQQMCFRSECLSMGAWLMHGINPSTSILETRFTLYPVWLHGPRRTYKSLLITSLWPLSSCCRSAVEISSRGGASVTQCITAEETNPSRTVQKPHYVLCLIVFFHEVAVTCFAPCWYGKVRLHHLLSQGPQALGP